jgi:uncharacterized tellurite resistance protein B-like protein
VLRALKGLLAELSDRPAAGGAEADRRHLESAVAGLLHEMVRADLKERPEEITAMHAALHDLFGLSGEQARTVLEDAGRHRYTSYFGPVAVIKRLLSIEQRIALVEHLWRVAFVDRELDPYEDHFVRKIAHLLYVPNTDAMLARQRARNETP